MLYFLFLSITKDYKVKLKRLFQILIIFILTKLLISCQIIKTTLKENECPKIQPICQPIKYTGVPRDTSLLAGKLNGWHYKIEAVKLVNSINDEWALSFSQITPYLTITDAKKNSVLICKYLTYNKIMPQKTLQIPEDGSYGFPAFYDNKMYISFAKDYSTNRQKEIIDAEGRILVPMSEAIGQSRIYSAIMKNDQPSNLEKLDFNNLKLEDWYSHPTVSADGKVIFFASDRDGGFGGVDIWMVYNDNGKLSEPINCGVEVNTACDEITPFISSDGKYLYFSSNGGETIGGYDIFRVKIDNSFFNQKIIKQEEIEKQRLLSNRENLRAPVNTQYNELSPNCLKDCDSIFYYSSNQNNVSNLHNNTGGYDIYVRYKEIIKEVVQKKEIKEPTLGIEQKEEFKIEGPKDNWFYKLEGYVYEERTKKPIQNAEVLAEESLSDVKNTVFTNQDGKYSIPMIKNQEYLITAQTKDLFPQNAKLLISSEDTTKIVRKDFYLPEIYTLRVNFPTDVYNNPYRYVLDSNGDETNITWEEEIKALANNILQVKDRIEKIVLVGHTDDVGSEEYNQKLGERRVNFVISKLIEYGVPKELLFGRSAGELEPLTKRDDESLDSYRKRLRRVVLEKIQK